MSIDVFSKRYEDWYKIQRERCIVHLNPPIGNSMILELSKTLKTTIDDKEFDFTKRHLNTCLRYLAAMIASKENCYLVYHA